MQMCDACVRAEIHLAYRSTCRGCAHCELDREARGGGGGFGGCLCFYAQSVYVVADPVFCSLDMSVAAIMACEPSVFCSL